MDFRLYFMIDKIVKGTPSIKIFNGFGRVALEKLSQNYPEDQTINVSYPDFLK